jgi:hypothetical protein
MREIATFGRIGDSYELLAGPNSDRDAQASAVKAIIEAGGNGKHEELLLVDIKQGAMKRRRIDPSQGGKKKSKAE